MRILVTGSSGFIGRFLIPELIAKGHEVVGLDVRVGPEFGGSFCFIRGNILDAGVLGGAMDGIDLVIHLAAEHKDFGVTDGLYHEVNVEGTKNLLRCAAERAVGKFVFFSSVAVYGSSPIPTHEGLECSPELPYGKSKLLAEHALEEWTQTDRSRSVV
ncbi:MAG: NAD-dependent epimerase/dehydratase family protein, partial [Sciscionella sp.]